MAAHFFSVRRRERCKLFRLDKRRGECYYNKVCEGVLKLPGL